MHWGWCDDSSSREKETWTVPDDGHKLGKMKSKTLSFIENVERR